MAAQEIQIPDAATRAAALSADMNPQSPLPPGAAQELTDIQGERMVLNMGPSHPATHGVLRLILELDGEIITKATPDIGYLHRGDEKIAENMTYNQFIPYTDRLDYLAPLANNVAYALAVEKLMGIDQQLPPRCQYIRVICCELARLSSHLLGLGSMAMDVGAANAPPVAAQPVSVPPASSVQRDTALPRLFAPAATAPLRCSVRSDCWFSSAASSGKHALQNSLVIHGTGRNHKRQTSSI